MKKFVEKMKRFWSLDAKTNGGFTLVELIVVIAILAILAGIAVPAYSGYVEKAKKAEDEQLLAAVNTAFAAACATNGENYYGRNDVSITLSGEAGAKKVDVVTVTGIEGFDGYFDGFYEGGEFKVVEELFYNPSVGGFSENSLVTVTYNGKEITFTAQEISSLKNSTFMNEEAGLGLESLLGKLDFTTNFAEALLAEDPENQSDALNAVIMDPIFQKTFAGYLGIDTAGKDETQIAEAIGAWAEANPEADQTEMMSNALVLYAAQNSTMSVQDATTLLTGDAKQSILTTLRGDGETPANTPAAMAQAALAYGMYTSYAHYTGDEDLIANAASPNALDVMNMLNDNEFKAYISGAQGQQDLNGYLNAMGMIDTAAGESAIAGGILSNGFTDQELNDLLKNVLK